jgi:hypothetical protein
MEEGKVSIFRRHCLKIQFLRPFLLVKENQRVQLIPLPEKCPTVALPCKAMGGYLLFYIGTSGDFQNYPLTQKSSLNI